MPPPITCRRCRRVYALPDPPPRLPACPYCGASPRPLLHVARSNVLATVLALAALVVLGFAFVKPFMAMTTIGEQRVVSLIEGIVELFERGHTLIAVVIFAFSVVFPVLKLLMILAATSRLVPADAMLRQTLHKIAAFTGKYSLLDVLVLAILIVLVKFEGIATVQVRIGTILFCLAILLSLAAGLCVNLEDERNIEPRRLRRGTRRGRRGEMTVGSGVMSQTDTNTASTQPPPAKRFRLLPWWLGLLIVALGAPGGYLLYETRPDPLAGHVHAIRIENNVTLANPSATAQEFVEKLKSLGSNPSLSLSVVAAGRDEPIKTPVREDTPIGNGLTFELPEPIARRDLREVQVWDEGFFSNKMIDRVDTGKALVESGQLFTFTLISPDAEPPMSRKRLVGWVLVIAAAAGVGIALVRFIALQVV